MNKSINKHKITLFFQALIISLPIFTLSYSVLAKFLSITLARFVYYGNWSPWIKLFSELILFCIIYFIVRRKILIGNSLNSPDAYINEFKRESLDNPPVTLGDLARRHYNDGVQKVNAENLSVVMDVLGPQILPITKFIEQDSSQSNILCVDGKWGSGKTTRVNIAINELKEQEKKCVKVYYESCYKYMIPGMSEYSRDMYSNIQAFMSVLGLGNYLLSDLIMDQSSKGLYSRIIQQDFNATASINKANSKYREKGLTEKLIIIIDDVDRLSNPNDIYQLFSIVSIVRRLSFVKIIIVCDKKRINSLLSNGDKAYDSKFLNKYIPDSNSVYVESEYLSMEEQALYLLNKNYEELNKPKKSIDKNNFCGAWSLIIIDHIDNEIQRIYTAKKERIDVIRWLSGSVSMPVEIVNSMPTWINSLRVLISNPNLIINDYDGAKWEEVKVSKGDFKVIRNKLLKLNKNNSGKLINILKDIEFDAAYKFIESIYKFASNNFEDIGLNYRDLQNSINKVAKKIPRNHESINRKENTMMILKVMD